MAVALLASAEAGAVVTQPGSAVSLPRPVGAAEWNLVTSAWAYNTQTQVNYDFTGMEVSQQNLRYGDFYPTFEDGDAITLQGLFKWQGEALDPTLDATATRGAFVPHCALSVELLLVGGSCQPVLYWYNTQTLSGGPPNAQELYPLIPTASSTIAADLQCQPPLDEGFCPLAWDNRVPRDLSELAWDGDPVVVDLTSDLNYQGGAIGFAIRSTETSWGCSSANYSLQEHNVRDALDRPFLAALMYQSGVDPEAVYLAFEEGAMLPGDWTNGGATDGDFNDYVIRVSGCFEAPNGAGGSGGEGAGGDSGEGGTHEAGQGGAGAAQPGQGGVATAGSPATEGGAAAAEAGGPGPASGDPGGAGTAPSPGGAGGDDASSPTASTSAGDGGCGCRWPGKRAPNAAILLSMLALAALRARKRLRRG